MKAKQIFSILVILLFSLASCREVTVTTVIHEDGSFTRIFTITGDSSDVFFSKNLPYPVDSTWIKEYSKDTTRSNNFSLTYSKTFRKSKELNDEVAADTGWRKQLYRHFDIGKSFGFFYSYPKYREVIKAANPFREYDYQDYLDQEDILWLSGQKIALNKVDSARLESADERANEYFEDVVSREIIKVLQKAIAGLDDQELLSQDVILYQDSIKHYLDNNWDHPDNYIELYYEWTKNPAVKKLNDIEPPIFQELNKKVHFLIEVLLMESYTVEAELPGIIMETNSAKLEGNKVEWKVDPMSFMFEDYMMYAQSRIVNIWAYWLSGGILVLLILVLVIKLVVRGK
ncbi:MAG: hypothetical protein KKA81_06880 [Bacteroidetes bacterium]|nr:hypothetical protein [Bacteroidota bacterium]